MLRFIAYSIIIYFICKETLTEAVKLITNLNIAIIGENIGNSKKVKESEYILKIPAYISKRVTNSKLVKNSYREMIDEIKLLVSNYIKLPDDQKAIYQRRAKMQSRQIDYIECIDYKYGNIPVVLLRISEHKKGLDGYLESETRKNIQPEDKVGSENNFVLLYPVIESKNGEDSNFWYIFVYDDPRKEDGDILDTVKLVIKKVLNLKTEHIKPRKLSEDLKKNYKINNMLVKYVTQYKKSDDDTTLKDFHVSTSVTETYSSSYTNIPSNVVEGFIQEEPEGFCKRVINFSLDGDKTIKITDLHKDCANGFQQTIEQSYNYEVLVDKTDDIYNIKYIFDAIEPLISRFLVNE